MLREWNLIISNKLAQESCQIEPNIFSQILLNTVIWVIKSSIGSRKLVGGNKGNLSSFLDSDCCHGNKITYQLLFLALR